MRHPQTWRQNGVQPETGAKGAAGAVCDADGAGECAE